MIENVRIGPFELDLQAAAAVLSSPDASNLAKLAKLGGLDPKKDFQGLDLRGLPLAGVDVRGMNFSHCNLRGTGIESALRDKTTILDGAELGYESALLVDLPPIPEDYQEQARAMILAGQAPPAHWAPLITELDFGDEADLRSIDALSGLTALRSLWLYGTGVSDVSALSGLTALQTLWLNDTGVADLSSLSGLTALQTLLLSGTSVTDLSSLSDLTGLQGLWLHGTAITDVSALSDLVGLRDLSLSSTGVTDLLALSGLTELQRLWLNGTAITDVSVLSGLPRLQELILDGTAITDLSALSDLPELAITVENTERVAAVQATLKPGSTVQIFAANWLEVDDDDETAPDSASDDAA